MAAKKKPAPPLSQPVVTSSFYSSMTTDDFSFYQPVVRNSRAGIVPAIPPDTQRLLNSIQAQQPGPVFSTVVPSVLRELSGSKDLKQMIAAVRARAKSFSSKGEMLLAAIAMVPEARMLTDRKMTEFWSRSTALPDMTDRELVIGAGVHGAVYAAARVAAGKPRPVIVDKSKRPGGALAVSESPSFYLNSRNEPGLISQPTISGYRGTVLPAANRGLNNLPGSLISPAMIPGGEFHDNTVLGWVVRLMLMQYAEVVPDTEVTGFRDTQREDVVQVKFSGAKTPVSVRRVINASGMGDANDFRGLANGKFIMTFPQLMAAMDKPFPLRGMQRVAVVGSGDGAKCAVEALLGIGPVAQGAVGLDYPILIDWYANNLAAYDYEGWRSGERGRYQRIGSDLPRQVDLEVRRRLAPINATGIVTPGMNCAYVNDRLYDHVIIAAGNIRQEFDGVPDNDGLTIVGTNPVVAKAQADREYYVVGPAASIVFSRKEQSDGIANRPANIAAIFRLAPRTVALAMQLA